MSKFTPGPWYIRSTMRTLETAFCIDASETCCVADVWADDDEAESNARLIAAAPAMYEALERLIKEHGMSYPMRREALKNAHAALAAAKEQQ